MIREDSLPTLMLIAASYPTVGYLCAFCNRLASSCRRSPCRRRAKAAVVFAGAQSAPLAPAGADLAATNCLLALAVLRLALDQPEADLASTVPIWLLILYPVPVLWYWAEANVRRCLKRRAGSNQSNGIYGEREQLYQFLQNGKKKLRVSLKTNTQPQAVERITVV